MPLLIPILIWLVTGVVARVLLGAGLAISSYVFIDGFVDDGLQAAIGYLGGLGDVGQLMYLAGIGDALSIIGSAIVAAVTLQAARVFLVRAQ